MSLREKFGIKLENSASGSTNIASEPPTRTPTTYSEYLNFVKEELSLCHVPKEHYTNELLKTALNHNALNFKYLGPEFQTKELIYIALNMKPWLIEFVSPEKFDDELCDFVLTLDALTLEFIPEQFKTYERCYGAIRRNPKALPYIPKEHRSQETLFSAVSQDGRTLRYFEDEEKSYDLCLVAVRQNHEAFYFVKKQTVELINIVREYKHSVVNNIRLEDVPIRDWEMKWFKDVTNVELRRSFVKERGKEVFNQLDNLFAVDEDNEYVLVKFRYGSNPRFVNEQRALIYECPSSHDVYFTEVDPTINTIGEALKFLNNDLGKEELAYES